MKIFWRLILPVILAVALGAGLVTSFAGRMISRPLRPLWQQPVFLYLAGAIFAAVLVVCLWNTLQWGEESEEFAARLEEEEAEEARHRR